MSKLSGYALITGAGSGIGHATALEYAKNGVAGLYLVDIDAASVAAVAKETQKLATNPDFTALTQGVDVTDEEAVNETVADAVEKFGRIDYAVNCAGVMSRAGFPQVADEPLVEFDRIFAVNVRGTLLCLKAELKAMAAQQPKTDVTARGEARGSIINFASIAAKRAIYGNTSYSASKGAVITLTEGAAVSHADDLIRINAVCPGFTNTPILADVDPEQKRATAAKVPFKRFAEPAEIADAVLFLSGPGAGYITGQCLSIDGGATIAY